MDRATCPACGANELSSEEITRSYAPPFGEQVTYQLGIQRCRVCGEAGDFAGGNSAKIKKIIEEADRASAAMILNSLAEAGLSMAYIERTLGLPQRTLARWKAGEVSAAGLALLRIVRTYPWILEVAAMRYEREAAREALHVAFVSSAESSWVRIREGLEVETISLEVDDNALIIKSNSLMAPAPEDESDAAGFTHARAKAA